MSIREQWKERVKEGRLFKLGFLIPGLAEKRTVLMSSEINALVSGPWTDNLMGDRCAKLRANLENILAGNRLTVCWEPFEADRRHQIGRLHPVEDGVFDIRSVDKPGLRVFFQFAEKDVLVLFTCSPRSVPVAWLKRLPLLNKESEEWKEAVSQSKREWFELFPGLPPFKGGSVSDCLSNAILG